MKLSLHILWLLVVAGLFLLISSNISFAAVDLPWSTTYDCNDWNSYGEPLNCDGLSKAGSWTCDQGGTYYEQITSDANNPAGAGGKGQRHWIGDGTNEVSGGIQINFTTPQPEFWVRWYMRYPSGFQWSSITDDKLLFFNSGSGAGDVSYGSGDKMHLRFKGVLYPSSDGTGWYSVNGGSVGDGQFHVYEAHLKMDTNGSNGIIEIWVDEILRVSYSNVNYGTTAGFPWIHVGENQKYPNNGQCMPIDFDDIAVNSTGYIGLYSGSTDTIKPDGPYQNELLRIE